MGPNPGIGLTSNCAEELGRSLIAAIPHLGDSRLARMHNFVLKISDKLRMPYDPSLLRRDQVVRFLAERPALSHEEWQRRFALDISLDFVRWFRDACSRHFEYDLSAALPEDRLVEDLGMYDATFSDVDMDILEEYEARYHAKIPEDSRSRIATLGQFLQALWQYVQHTNAL